MWTKRRREKVPKFRLNWRWGICLLRGEESASSLTEHQRKRWRRWPRVEHGIIDPPNFAGENKQQKVRLIRIITQSKQIFSRPYRYSIHFRMICGNILNCYWVEKRPTGISLIVCLTARWTYPCIELNRIEPKGVLIKCVTMLIVDPWIGSIRINSLIN